MAPSHLVAVPHSFAKATKSTAGLLAPVDSRNAADRRAGTPRSQPLPADEPPRRCGGRRRIGGEWLDRWGRPRRWLCRPVPGRVLIEASEPVGPVYRCLTPSIRNNSASCLYLAGGLAGGVRVGSRLPRRVGLADDARHPTGEVCEGTGRVDRRATGGSAARDRRRTAGRAS
jgi:hypothetical protein